MNKIAQGMLCIKVGEELISVAPCQVFDTGEVMTSKLSDRESKTKKTIDFFRIGHLNEDAMQKIGESIDD